MLDTKPLLKSLAIALALVACGAVVATRFGRDMIDDLCTYTYTTLIAGYLYLILFAVHRVLLCLT